MTSMLLPVTLPASTYRKLEEQARKEERHPIRQAQWLLKRALESNESDRTATAASGQ